MPQVESLPAALNTLGWDAAQPDLWDSLRAQPPQVAILAPTVDTVPSLQGNAVYTLIEALARKLPIPNVVFARRFADQPPDSGDVRVLYYQPALEPTLLDRLPYRVRRPLFGTARPGWRPYARAAARACRVLGVTTLMIEDLPNLGLAARGVNSELRLVLHQHSVSPVPLPRFWWDRMIRVYATVVFVSQTSVTAMEARQSPLPIPTQVIYNGVDLSHYDPQRWQRAGRELRLQLGIPISAPVLLFAGRIIPDKGVLEAARAFVEASVTGAHCIVAGDLERSLYRDAAYVEQLRQLAAAHPSVHLVGTISQSELPVYYAASDVVVMPSVGSEGLPKVITEALAMGKPVMATARGGSWELLNLDSSGWLIADPLDSHAFADQIRQVLSNTDEIRRRSDHILDADRPKMSDEAMIEQMARVLVPSYQRQARADALK